MTPFQASLLPRDETRPSIWIGVDPGQTGALAVLEDGQTGRLIFAATWRPKAKDGVKGYEARWWMAELTHDPRHWSQLLSGAGDAIGFELFGRLNEHGHAEGLTKPLASLCLENIFIGKNPRDALTLAEEAGMWLGGFQAFLPLQPSRVMATAWRSVVLARGAGRWTAEQAKQQALKLLPLRVAGLGAALEALGNPHHLAEAAGIACWDRATWATRGGR